MSANATLGSAPGRGWVTAAAAVLGAFLALGLIADAFVPAPQGPAGSSYATTPAGVAAWAELLGRAGHPVRQLRQSLASAQLPPQATVVVLGPNRLTRADGRSLDRFVHAGGRLVIGGGDPVRALPALLPDPPGWTAGGARVLHSIAPTPEARGVRTVLTAGEGAWTVGPGLRVLAARGGGTLLLVRELGSGRIDLLADSSPVENRLLASADNARLALDLAGEDGRPVIFAEGLHGFGAATGLAAIPGRWWLAVAALCLAGGAWALARGRRIGPPEQPSPAGAPPRSAYVTGLAGVLLRARDPRGVAQLARSAAQLELERRLIPRAGAHAPDRSETLRRLGMTGPEVEAMFGSSPPRDVDAELLALGSALARLRSGG